MHQAEKDEIVNTFLNTMESYNTLKKDIIVGRVQEVQAEKVKTPTVTVLKTNQDFEGL